MARFPTRGRTGTPEKIIDEGPGLKIRDREGRLLEIIGEPAEVTKARLDRLGLDENYNPKA